MEGLGPRGSGLAARIPTPEPRVLLGCSFDAWTRATRWWARATVVERLS
jgi:hypothetical protein